MGVQGEGEGEEWSFRGHGSGGGGLTYANPHIHIPPQQSYPHMSIRTAQQLRRFHVKG